jgi:hypothetical protein
MTHEYREIQDMETHIGGMIGLMDLARASSSWKS